MVNNILIEVLASIAQQERETIRVRQAEGIVAAKGKGGRLGRPFIQPPANSRMCSERRDHGCKGNGIDRFEARHVL